MFKLTSGICVDGIDPSVDRVHVIIVYVVVGICCLSLIIGVCDRVGVSHCEGDVVPTIGDVGVKVDDVGCVISGVLGQGCDPKAKEAANSQESGNDKGQDTQQVPGLDETVPPVCVRHWVIHPWVIVIVVVHISPAVFPPSVRGPLFQIVLVLPVLKLDLSFVTIKVEINIVFYTIFF